MGRLIEGEIVEEIAEIDIDHVADRNHMREAEAARRRPVDGGGHQRPGLADECKPAGQRREMSEACVDAFCRRNDPQAIRAENAHEVRFRGRERLSPKLGTLGAATLAEAGGEDDGGAGAAGAERGDDLRKGWRRRGDDRKIRDQGKLFDRTVVDGRSDRLLMRVDRQDRAGESCPEKVLRSHRADGARLIAGADQGDRFRFEESVEIARGHDDGFPREKAIVIDLIVVSDRIELRSIEASKIKNVCK